MLVAPFSSHEIYVVKNVFNTALDLEMDIFIYQCSNAHQNMLVNGSRFFGHIKCIPNSTHHNDDVIMSAMASQITNLTTVYTTVFSGQSSASLAFVCTKGQYRGKWQWQWKDIYCQSCTKKISQSYKYTIQLKGQQLSISTMKSQLWQWRLK